MNTELEVLKKIYKGSNPSTARQRKKHRVKTPVKLISNYLGYGLDYIRFICKRLKERDLIREVGRDWYKITQKGRKELERRGLIKAPFLKKGLKIKKAIWKTVRMESVPVISKNIKLKPNFEKTKAEKLKLGKTIEKVAAFLRSFKKFNN